MKYRSFSPLPRLYPGGGLEGILLWIHSIHENSQNMYLLWIPIRSIFVRIFRLFLKANVCCPYFLLLPRSSPRWRDWFIKEKAQESVSVAVLRFEASRIALSMSDGNTQKPTLIYVNDNYSHVPSREYGHNHNITYPRASTVAQSLT